MITSFVASNIIMNIIVISLFLGVFFFTYGTYLEKEIMKNQVDYLVDDLISPIKVFIPQDTMKRINLKLNTFNISIDKLGDEKVKKNNKEIIKKATIAIGVSIIAAIIIITIISKKFNKENMSTGEFWGKLIKYNLVSILFIGITQFIFTTRFSKNFMTIDINLLKEFTLNNILNKLNK